MYSVKDFTPQQVNAIVAPKKWPKPLYNPQKDNTQFELGKKLFYDPKLSRDGTISCANCHLSFTAFTHVDHAVSHGIDGKKGTRNSPVLINLAWNNTFHWDGGVNHIEMQTINPIQHPLEMDNSLENVIAYLYSNTEYKTLFYKAYSDSAASTKKMFRAFAYFNSQLISSNSKYDRYKNKELKLSKQEKNGMKLFKNNCNSCHTAPLFNSNIYASNGLSIDSNYNDLGRYTITNIGSDSLKFRVPTLRNIEHSYPYMHDGRFNSLREVLDHYTNNIDTNNPYLSQELRKKIVLSDNDKKDLIAFLKTLTDKEFLYDKRFRPNR